MKNNIIILLLLFLGIISSEAQTNLASAVQESHYPTLNNPRPEQTYRSPAYWEAIRFAASEAQRLGLEIGLHNTVGYSTTGGPWIDEEQSMQRLVWSDTIISGGAELKVLDPVKEHLGEHMGKSFKHMLIHSYEAGNQNWTPEFREEFIQRKGYDPIPWLASFSPTVGTGKDNKDRRIVGNEDQTARFDWDYRDVIDQLFYENGWNIGKKMLKDAMLDLQPTKFLRRELIA